MSKKLIALVIGITFLLGGTTVLAYKELPWTKNIYQISSQEDRGANVSMFDYGKDRCYIVSPGGIGGPSGISCVKR